MYNVSLLKSVVSHILACLTLWQEMGTAPEISSLNFLKEVENVSISRCEMIQAAPSSVIMHQDLIVLV